MMCASTTLCTPVAVCSRDGSIPGWLSKQLSLYDCCLLHPFTLIEGMSPSFMLTHCSNITAPIRFVVFSTRIGIFSFFYIITNAWHTRNINQLNLYLATEPWRVSRCGGVFCEHIFTLQLKPFSIHGTQIEHPMAEKVMSTSDLDIFVIDTVKKVAWNSQR